MKRDSLLTAARNAIMRNEQLKKYKEQIVREIYATIDILNMLNTNTKSYKDLVRMMNMYFNERRSWEEIGEELGIDAKEAWKLYKFVEEEVANIIVSIISDYIDKGLIDCPIPSYVKNFNEDVYEDILYKTTVDFLNKYIDRYSLSHYNRTCKNDNRKNISLFD
jgi:hypothetical protein